MTDQRRAGGSGPHRRPSDAARLRKEAERRARNAPSARTPTGRTGGGRDVNLPPHDRGPVRAFIRDEVDARRRLVGAFLPVLGIVVISVLSPASDWQRYALIASLATLAVILADAVVMGVTVTRDARAAFPGEQVPALATGWYAFLRAHRSRALRRPAPRVSPGGRGPRAPR